MTNDEIAKVIVENIEPLSALLKWFFFVAVAAFVGAITWSWKLSAAFKGFKGAIEGLESKVDALGKRMAATESYLHNLCGHLGKETPQFRAFTQTNSPITLTPYGEELAQQSGFNAFVEAHAALWSGIADEAKDRLDAESYIEKAAFKKVRTLFDDDDPRVAEVSLYIFEHGLRHDEGLYDGLLQAFGVVARDAAFRIAGIDIPIAPQ